MPDDTRTCSICGKTFTNSGKNVLIQEDLLTGKNVCIDCAFKDWEDQDEPNPKPKGKTYTFSAEDAKVLAEKFTENLKRLSNEPDKR